VAEKRARLNLARGAARLAAQHNTRLPALVLMTDDDRLSDPLGAAHALPRGSMVIVRARQSVHRAELAAEILKIATERSLFVLIAADAALAARLGADGLHLPEARAREAAHWRTLHPRWVITTSTHGTSRIPPAVDAVFLTSVFPTQSHKARAHLGPMKASVIAATIRKPVYALGGIDSCNAARLSNAFAGIAAIGALSV
jgi:thiamine-phosphate pyrophosphorylase